jgi:hypothetical protein
LGDVNSPNCSEHQKEHSQQWPTRIEATHHACNECDRNEIPDQGDQRLEMHEMEQKKSRDEGTENQVTSNDFLGEEPMLGGGMGSVSL